MKGDSIIVEDHHRKAAAGVVPAILPQIRRSSGRFTVSAAVGGEFYLAAMDDLGSGEAMFLVVPEPTSLAVLVVGGLACLMGSRQRPVT